MDVVSVVDQRGDEARRRALDAAVQGERPRDDQELHCSGCREAGLDRGWPEREATRLRMPASALSACEPGSRGREAGLDRGWPEKDATRLRGARFIPGDSALSVCEPGTRRQTVDQREQGRARGAEAVAGAAALARAPAQRCGLVLVLQEPT